MQRSYPIVSVVIPNYNHSRYLPQRIESVLHQSLQDIEIIILDDCSPDHSREIIDQYAAQDARIRVVYNEQNSGSTFKQWNKGIALAQGKYVWLAESDDYADPALLTELVARMEANPAVGLAYCASFAVDEDGRDIKALDDFYTDLDPVLWTKDFVLDGRFLITNFMSYRNIIPNASAVVIRKHVLDKVGKAEDNFKLNGDWVFWAAIIADVKVAYIAKKLNYFRFHLNNVRSKSLVKGVALHEMSRVVLEMQQYGEPNTVFLNAAVDSITKGWVKDIILSKIPLKTNIAIFRILRTVNPNFTKSFVAHFAKFLFSNKLSGIRQLLGDGLLYKITRNG